MFFHIVGVHRIDAPEPCHLIEVQLTDALPFDWGSVTQENASQPESNWQVAYDEQPLVQAPGHWAFFFHYLDFTKPLLTPFGPVHLPPPTPLPNHLSKIEYWPP